jgi:hypothetical protein
MTPRQRRTLLRLEIVGAEMRLGWAMAEAKSSPITPALTKFIEDSREKCRAFKSKLAKVNRLLRLEKLAKELHLN